MTYTDTRSAQNCANPSTNVGAYLMDSLLPAISAFTMPQFMVQWLKMAKCFVCNSSNTYSCMLTYPGFVIALHHC